MSSYPSFQTQTTRQLNELQAQVRPQAIAPNHLIRLCRTVEVSSLLEMREALPRHLTSDLRPITRFTLNDALYFYDPVAQKLTLNAPDPALFVWSTFAGLAAQHNTFRIGVSYYETTEELLKEETYSEEYLKNFLFYIIDVKETQLFHRLLTARSVPVLVSPQTFLGALAYLQTVMQFLEAGSENFYFLVPANLMFHILREAPPRLGGAHNFFTHSERAKTHIVPFTQSNTADASRNYITAYSDYLVNTTTRYVFERFYIEKIDRWGLDQRDFNTYRIVAERYVSYAFPALLAPPQALPGVQTWAVSTNVLAARTNTNTDELPAPRDNSAYESYINNFW